MNTVYLSTLEVGKQFRFRYQIPSNALFQVQHKLISHTGGIGVVSLTPNVSGEGVYHPKTLVIPV